MLEATLESEKEVLDLLDRSSQYRERLNQADVPSDLKEMMESYISKTKDKVTGLQLRWAFEETIEELIEKEIDFSIAALDFRNLGGLNSKLGHEKTNNILYQVIRIVEKAVKESGGEIYRSGGDEFHIIKVREDSSSLVTILTNVQKEIESAIVIKNKLDKLPHKSQGGMPTGAGNIDFGCVNSEGRKKEELLMLIEEQCDANKEKFLETIARKEMNNGNLWEKDKKTQRYTLAQKVKRVEK